MSMIFHKKIEHDTSDEWVVFIHGAGGSSSVWHKQLRSFKNEFNILLLDLRGHGKSQPKHKRFFQTPYTFNNISKDVIDLLDHLKIDSAHFVGISLGSIVIRSIEEQATERVKSMVLGGAVVRLDFRSKFLVTSGNLVKRFVPFIWLYKLYAFIIMPRKNHTESRKLFIEQAKRLVRTEFLKWFKLTKGINKLLYYFQEKNLGQPVLYIMGGQDHLFLEPVKFLVKDQQNSYLKIIPNCGHVCNVESPDMFNESGISFIKRHT